MIQSVGRNDLCPCGSGKKYKHCHGRPKPPADVLYIHPPKQDIDFYEQNQPARDGQMGRPYGLIPMGVPALVNVLRALKCTASTIRWNANSTGGLTSANGYERRRTHG